MNLTLAQQETLANFMKEVMVEDYGGYVLFWDDKVQIDGIFTVTPELRKILMMFRYDR